MQGLRDCQSKRSKSLQSKSSNLHNCLRSEDSANTPCIEQNETTVLVLLLKEYWSPVWSPKQGREGCGSQNLLAVVAVVTLYTDFYLGKPDLPRANSSKISRGKFISGFVLIKNSGKVTLLISAAKVFTDS